MITWLKNLFKKSDLPVYHYYSGKCVYLTACSGRRRFIETLFRTNVLTDETWRLRELPKHTGEWVPMTKPKWYSPDRSCARPYFMYNSMNREYLLRKSSEQS